MFKEFNTEMFVEHPVDKHEVIITVNDDETTTIVCKTCGKTLAENENYDPAFIRGMQRAYSLLKNTQVISDEKKAEIKQRIEAVAKDDALLNKLNMIKESLNIDITEQISGEELYNKIIETYNDNISAEERKENMIAFRKAMERSHEEVDKEVEKLKNFFVEE